MEIPYIVTPRKDTGLFNSKIAIWLFLASEVMLFGGFFSSYIFLRIYADYPWPERTLPVLPGLINTFVLIGSSITVVFAWSALKLREWRKFQLFMGITVACAGVFMVLKGIEYYTKFHHQAVRLSDYTVLEGHLGEYKDGPLKGQEENRIFFNADQVSVSTVRYHKPYLETIIEDAKVGGSKLLLTAPIELGTGNGKRTIAAGTELSMDLLKELRGLHRAARGNNSDIRTNALRAAWKVAKDAKPDAVSRDLAGEVRIDEAGLEGLLTEVSNVAFKVEPPMAFSFPSTLVKATADRLTLKDSTSMGGELQESPMMLHYVDAVDFRYLAMKASARGLDPMAAIEKSWILENSPEIRQAWEWHKGQIEKLDAHLLKKHGRHPKTNEPRRVATETERYRIGWHGFAARAEGVDMGDNSVDSREHFLGPNYKKRVNAFPEMELPREKVAFESKFMPKWNTYYAIYFTMTGLHGLHVIGGALVLGYYLFFGRKMYLTNPEWLANRVEVGGLFWHFVDLVWIFLFPILYLM